MKFDESMYITNKIIENEFIHVQDENLENMNDLERYKKIIEDNDERYSVLIKALPKELQEILMQFSDACNDRITYEIQHYFKKGVAAGTSNLNFLRDITGGINFY